MSSGNQQLGFAIRAVNEASSAIDEVTKDLGFMESAAAGAEPELKDLSQALGQLQTDVQDFASELEDAGGKFTVTREGLDQVAEGAGNLERVLIGSKDILGVLEEQFGVSVGPMVEWSQAAADVAGGVEGIISGGSALVQQLGPMAAGLGPVIASTWAHVTALGAQAVAFALANAPLLLIIGGFALLAAGIVLLVQHWDDIKPHVQPVIDLFNNDVVPAANAVWEKGLKPVIDFVEGHWKEIGALILLPFAPIILIATDAFGIRSGLLEGFGAVIRFVTDNWPVIASLILLPFAPLILLATNSFGLRDKFEEGMTAMRDFASARIKDIIGFFTDLPGDIISAIGDVRGILAGVGKDLIQGLINGMNSVPIPNPLDLVPGGGIVKGAVGKIPGFADGGVVPGPIGSPQLAVVHGGETVVPAGRGFGTTIVNHYHFHGFVGDVDALADELARRSVA